MDKDIKSNPRGAERSSRPENGSVVVIKLPVSEKAGWVRQAQREKKKLVEWIKDRCRVE